MSELISPSSASPPGRKAGSGKLAKKPRQCTSPMRRITGSMAAPYSSSSLADSFSISG